MSEIVNRVANSKLITFDLEHYYTEGKRVCIDLKDWLFEEIILKEKDFRAAIAAHSWEQYEGAYVALYCSTDAIVPAWAYMLITSRLQPFAAKIVQGPLEILEAALFQSALEDINFEAYRDRAVIIKGCSSKPVPNAAYGMATQKLQTVARSIFYGEACSSVPVYKQNSVNK